MERAATIEQARAAVARARASGDRIGLVPTMGALHDGHLSLIHAARKRSAYVVVSVFVNPAQFGPDEDYESYPRTLDEDARLAKQAGAALVFAPSAEEMYPGGVATRVQVERLTGPLCGARRPGHFDGVALVVTKLLNIVQPDVSVFGQKDAQQAAVIRRLARDLNLPGEIVIVPTVREADGLAMSSRNRYLDAEDRQAAVALSRGLDAARNAYDAGERSAEALVAVVERELDGEARVRKDYVDVRRADDLEPWTGDGPALLAVAAFVGPARLIDNVILGEAAAGAETARAAEGKTT